MTRCETRDVDYSPDGFVLRQCERPATVRIKRRSGVVLTCEEHEEHWLVAARAADDLVAWEVVR